MGQVVKHLTHIRQQYDREGYVVVHNVIDAGLVEEVRRHIDWLREKNPGMRALESA